MMTVKIPSKDSSENVYIIEKTSEFEKNDQVLIKNLWNSKIKLFSGDINFSSPEVTEHCEKSKKHFETISEACRNKTTCIIQDCKFDYNENRFVYDISLNGKIFENVLEENLISSLTKNI